MKLFLKYVGSFLRSYPQIKFNKNDEIIVRNSAMNHLGLSNLNQMRDRYEGQSFFEKTMKNIGGLMALQKYLKKDILDVNSANLTDFQPYIILDGRKIDIHVFDFGTLPLLKVGDIENPIYFIIQKDSLTFLLCGVAEVEVVKEYIKESSVERSSPDEYKDFTGFKFLKKIEA